MKRMIFIGMLFLIATSCRLPVDINLDRYPGLQVVCYRSMDGRPFDGVSVEVRDPLNRSTTDGNGSATMLVYTQAGGCEVTYEWWTVTPMRQRTATVGYPLGKGLNVYAAVLNDNPYSGYGKLDPNGSPIDTSGTIDLGVISMTKLVVHGNDTTFVPVSLRNENGILVAE